MTNAVQSPDDETAVAVRIAEELDEEGFPGESAWGAAPLIRFQTDWRGKNGDPERETEVRLLWTTELLFVRFSAHFRTITVFADAEASGRRDQLWERDVAEIFLQPEVSDPRCYKEFEVSPNGFWIDLDICHGEKHDLQSGLRRKVSINQTGKLWIAELAIAMKCLVSLFEPLNVWRVNFYRVEGAAEPRFYSAWRPTNSPQPNFHVPEAFGKLVFAPSPGKRDFGT
jgi:alpha-galactosidase